LLKIDSTFNFKPYSIRPEGDTVPQVLFFFMLFSNQILNANLVSKV